jgi:hypothetical protein
MANVNYTTSLTQEVQTYYEKVFLARSEYELILKEGAQMRKSPKLYIQTYTTRRNFPRKHGFSSKWCTTNFSSKVYIGRIRIT